MQLIDIGVNLSHDSFDHDRDAVVQRARDAGVARMIVTGASREHSPKALELARMHPGVLYATAGVHPHHASEYTAECDAEMRALLAHPEVVAVGETGLDYFRDFYADTATFGSRPALECALAFFGPDHMLFSSDAPFDPERGPMYIRETIKCIDAMDLSEEDRHKIYHRNAEEMLGV